MNSNSSLMSRLGLYAAVLALIAFLIPVVALLLGAIGVVQMNTSDDIKSLLSNAVIVGIIALVLAVVATLLNLPGLFSEPRQGVITLIGSVLLLLLSAGFLFGLVLPRASAVQNINDNIVPYAQAMRDNCKAPLNTTIEDLRTIRSVSVANNTNDAGYAGTVGTYIAVLKQDDGRLADGVGGVLQTKVPDPKYQDLKDQCLQSLRGLQGFLDKPSAVPIPAALGTLLAPLAPALGTSAVVTNGAIASVSGFGLLNLSVLVAGSGVAPAGTAQTAVTAAMNTVIGSTNQRLTDDGDALVKDIKDGLDNNLAPFQVNVPVS
jgi:multisubunit Na+/H+ antiporter MnhG subunit